jgi:hypothetical protein
VVHRGEISEAITAADVESRIAEWLDQPHEASLAASVVAAPRITTSAGESMSARSLPRTRVDLRRESVRGVEASGELSLPINSSVDIRRIAEEGEP